LSPMGTQPSSAGNTAAVSSNIIPNDPLYTVQYINDPAWPAELCLDPSVLNWSEWSRRLRLLCKRQGLGVWLEGTFAPPNPISDTCGYCVWTINDNSIQAFILQHVCKQDYKDICNLPSSCVMFSELRKHYEKLGSHMQILLMEKAIRMEFVPGTCLSQTWDELDTLMRKIKAMGPLDYDQLQIACVIKGLGKHYEHLQSTLQSIMNQLNFTLRDIGRRIIEEDNLICNREEQGLLPTSTAFASQTIGKPHMRMTCSHCKCVRHFTEFCVQPGGKMAGCTLDEAKAAYRASWGHRSDGSAVTGNTSANVAVTGTTAPTTDSKGTMEPFYFHGVPYNLVPATATRSSMGSLLMPSTGGTTGTFTNANIATIDRGYDFDFMAHIAIFGEPRASIDWRKEAKSVDLNQVPVTPVAYTASCVPIRSLAESPFFLDTGANAHISPERSDFKTLCSISPHPITGLGGSCIFAVSIGTIDIQIAGGHKLTLDNVLFTPASNVRLVSVLDMNNTGGHYVSHFSHDSFWLTNSSGATILHGNIHKTCWLYYLSISRALTTHIRNKSHETDSPSKIGSDEAHHSPSCVLCPKHRNLASTTWPLQLWGDHRYGQEAHR